MPYIFQAENPKISRTEIKGLVGEDRTLKFKVPLGLSNGLSPALQALLPGWVQG